MKMNAIVLTLLLVLGVVCDQLTDDRMDVEVLNLGAALPVQVKFSPSGRMLVLEKEGRIREYTGLEDRSGGRILCDMRDKVYSWWDHGMLGMELHPEYETNGVLYVTYSAAAWSDGTPTGYGDTCTGEYCESSARVSQLTTFADGQCVEKVLLAGACSTSPAHHIADILMDRDGMLFVSIGDSSHYSFTDHGIDPETGEYEFCVTNPDEDVGATAFGSYRAQSDHLLQGKLLRLDPNAMVREDYDPRNVSHFAAPNNPNPASPIVAKGLRMPFRLTQNPNSGDLLIADVGGAVYETIWTFPIDSLTSPAPELPNYGWPCREAGNINAAHDMAFCDEINQEPLFVYNHAEVLGDCANTGQSSVSALVFYDGDMLPEEYHGALIFGDFARECVWYVRSDGNGGLERDEAGELVIRTLDTWIPFPVDLTVAPDGSLIVVSVFGDIRRVLVEQGGTPKAQLVASEVDGPAPLAVFLDASGSYEETGAPISFEWSIVNGRDAAMFVAGNSTLSVSLAQGVYQVGVRVTNELNGESASKFIEVVSGLSLDIAIELPSPLVEWSAGDQLNISASATDQDGAAVSADAFAWDIGLWHCVFRPCLSEDFDCHRHSLITQAGGAHVLMTGPNHNYPSYLEIVVSVTNNGLTRTASALWYPQPVEIALTANVPEVHAVLAEVDCVAPCLVPAIRGSPVSAHVPQLITTPSGELWEFSHWFDGTETRDRTLFADELEIHLHAVYERKELPVCSQAPSMSSPSGLAAEPRCFGAELMWADEDLAERYFLVRWVPDRNLFVSLASESIHSQNSYYTYSSTDSGVTTQETTCSSSFVHTNAHAHHELVSEARWHLEPIAADADLTWAVSVITRDAASGEWCQGPPSPVHLAHTSPAAEACDRSCPFLRVTHEHDETVALYAGQFNVLPLSVKAVHDHLVSVTARVTAIDGVPQSDVDAIPTMEYAELMSGERWFVDAEIPLGALTKGGVYHVTVELLYTVNSMPTLAFQQRHVQSIPLQVMGPEQRFRFDILALPALSPTYFNQFEVPVVVHVPEGDDVWELVIDILDATYKWYGGCDLPLSTAGWASYTAVMKNVNLPLGVELRYSAYIRPTGTTYQEAAYWWQADPLYRPLTVTGTSDESPPSVRDVVVPVACIHGCEERPGFLATCALSGECLYEVDPAAPPPPEPVTCLNPIEGVAVPAVPTIEFDAAQSPFMSTAAGVVSMQGLRVFQNSGEDLELVVNLIEVGTWAWLGGGVRVTVPSCEQWQQLDVPQITHKAVDCKNVQWSMFLTPVGGEWAARVAFTSKTIVRTATAVSLEPMVATVDAAAGVALITNVAVDNALAGMDIVANLLDGGSYAWFGGVRVALQEQCGRQVVSLEIPHTQLSCTNTIVSVFVAAQGGEWVDAVSHANIQIDVSASALCAA